MKIPLFISVIVLLISSQQALGLKIFYCDFVDSWGDWHNDNKPAIQLNDKVTFGAWEHLEEISVPITASKFVYPNRYYKCTGADEDLLGVFMIKYQGGTAGLSISKALATKKRFEKADVEIIQVDNSVVAFLVNVGKIDEAEKKKAKEMLVMAQCKKSFSPSFSIERLMRLKRLFRVRCNDLTMRDYIKYNDEERSYQDERVTLTRSCLASDKFREEQKKLDEMEAAKKDVIIAGVKLVLGAIPVVGAVGDLVGLADKVVKALAAADAIVNTMSDAKEMIDKIGDTLTGDKLTSLEITAEEMVAAGAMDQAITAFDKDYIQIIMPILATKTAEEKKKVCPSKLKTAVNVVRAGIKLGKMGKFRGVQPEY